MAALVVTVKQGSRGHLLRPLASLVTQSQTENNNRHASTYHSALVPKGLGGRSSFSGIVAAVFGATGFTGKYIVNRLGREGSQVIMPYRCENYYLNRFKVMGDLGQVMFREYSVRDTDLIRDIVKNCNVVINLLGQDYETRNFPFQDIHIEVPRTLARICREENVNKFIHMSALGADLSSPSKFLRTKAAGETVVRDEFPEAIIVRPAQILGAEDRYFNHFANQRYFGGVPLYMNADKVVKRPVFVTDVAEAIIALAKSKELSGKTVELVGPNGYLLSELVDFIYRVTRRPYVRYPVPRPILRLLASVMELTPFVPWMSRDMLELQHTTENVEAETIKFSDLNISPLSIETAAIRVLRIHRADRYFDLGIDEIEAAPFVK